MGCCADDRAFSEVHAVLLLVAITCLLALLVLLFFKMPVMEWEGPALPAVLIESVDHVSDRSPYGLNYDSRMTLYHNGSARFENDRIKAVIYRNGERVCIIPTLNGYRYIQSHHYGSERIEGDGCCTPYWNPHERIEIDITDGTLYPGVDVTVEIVDRDTNRILSTHTVTA
jgi:hypothetical protein